jgi:hypothetical protein
VRAQQCSGGGETSEVYDIGRLTHVSMVSSTPARPRQDECIASAGLDIEFKDCPASSTKNCTPRSLAVCNSKDKVESNVRKNYLSVRLGW